MSLTSVLVFALVLTLPGCSAYDIFSVCDEFDPALKPACGTNVISAGGSWIDHKKSNLPRVAASNMLITNYVLYFGIESMDAGETSAAATYRLEQPQGADLNELSKLCVRIELIASKPCEPDGSYQCRANATLYDELYGKTFEADNSFDYMDGAWTIKNFEFNVTGKSSGTRIRVLINGFIEAKGEANAKDLILIQHTDKFPYMALERIIVQNGECPKRIGRRVVIWISIGVGFTILTLFTFFYIFWLHSVRQFNRRIVQVTPQLLRPNQAAAKLQDEPVKNNLLSESSIFQQSNPT